jgi:uncharacterized protein DUF2726
LLTKKEAAFFRVLSVTPNSAYLVSCKVRLAVIITCNDNDWKRGQANRIAQKHVDFVVSCARTSRIVAAIELDGCSHLRPVRRVAAPPDVAIHREEVWRRDRFALLFAKFQNVQSRQPTAGAR